MVPRQIRLKLAKGDGLRNVDGEDRVIRIFAILPGQVIVAVDERVLGLERASAVEVGVARGLRRRARRRGRQDDGRH